MSTSTLHLGIFYMPQICDMGPTALLPLRRKACWGFFSPLKIRRLQPGLNPWTWVLKASTLTPRPPKPLCVVLLSRAAEHFLHSHTNRRNFIYLFSPNVFIRRSPIICPVWPRGFQEVLAPRIPWHLAHESGEVSLTQRPPLPPGNIPGTHFH